MRLLSLASAVAVAAPLVLVSTPGTAVGDLARPVRPEVQTYAFGGGASAAGTDATGPVTATREVQIPADGVRVVGVTWDASAADAGTTVEVRHRSAGTWSPWSTLDVEESADAGEAETARGGTEPFVVDDSDLVQARLTVEDGTVPAGARLDVVDPGTSPADSAVGPVGGSVIATATRPLVRTRAEWGADESIRRGEPSYSSSVRAAVVHHTAGSNTYSSAETPGVIRGIYAFHVKSRGWSDVGYNMLADKYGRLWEGRYGGIDRPVVGAHVSDYNTGSFGISVMGTYESAAPPASAISAVTQAIAWKLDLHGVSATGQTTLSGKTIPTIVGHRDIGSTACPGAAFYERLPAMRIAAAQLQAAAPAPAPAPPPEPTPEPVAPPAPPVPVVRDFTGDGVPDVLSRTAGQVRMSPRALYPVQSPARQIGHGWGAMSDVLGTPDMTGDGRADLLARDTVSGKLSLYSGDGRGGFAGSRTVGSGWNAMSLLVTPGDWNGDRRADLLAVEAATGTMWLYPGNGAGRFSGRTAIGIGWQHTRMLTSGWDLDTNGLPDLVAVDTSGALRLYSGNGRGRFGTTKVIGSGWADFDRLLGAGDFDGDRKPDLLARLADGRMTSFYGNGDGQFEFTMPWGNGWNGMATLSSAGDWDGDGRSDVLAVSRSTGLMHLYRGVGGRHYAPTQNLGVPANDVRDLVVVGDVDGQGGADVITRDSAGRMFLAMVSSAGKVTSVKQVGHGWSVMDVVTAAGDLSSDGVPDVLARETSTGRLFVYPMTRSGAFSARQQVGVGWGGFDLVLGAGPWDEGGTADVIARRASDGALFVYPGIAPSKLGSPRQIGSGWSGMSSVIVGGDMDRDGAPDLLARTAAGVDVLYRSNGAGLFIGTQVMQGLPRDGVLS